MDNWMGRIEKIRVEGNFDVFNMKNLVNDYIVNWDRN